MAGQSRCDSSGIDIWHGHMVDLLDHTDHVRHADLGFRTQGLAYISGI